MSVHQSSENPDHILTVPALWSQQQLCDYIGKSTSWAEQSRWAGTGPKFIKIGRHVRYRVADVMSWIQSMNPEVA